MAGNAGIGPLCICSKSKKNPACVIHNARPKNWPRGKIPRHNLKAQIKTLGADSLLPDWKP